MKKTLSDSSDALFSLLLGSREKRSKRYISNTFRPVLLMVLGFIFLSDFAVAANVDDGDSLQAKLNVIHTLSASFIQEISAQKRHVSTTSGRMALSRPGLFRWQTNQPTPQLVVADGKHIWIYDKELEQVSVKKQTKAMGGVAALFLSEDPAALKHDFKVIKTDNASREVFTLFARSTKASFEKIQLVFKAQQLNQMILYDQLGQRTQINLSEVKTNTKLADQLFHFSVPRGVDVVQQ